ncbi:MAG TPA: tRNA pseudouridine(55) synthase TruB [Bacillota bacterium]|nr:tRNA pseudouridine(55) synthase TruB [Bacillota bacterium]
MSETEPESGLLLIDKPEGMTSFHVVSMVRRLFSVKKVGHIGTLDPFASGVLPICIGSATKMIRYMENVSKEYRATLSLGKITETGDTEGAVVGGRLPTQEEINVLQATDFAPIRECILQLRGSLTQVPSRYSAIKIQGRPAYDYARKGIDVEIAPREVTIFDTTIYEITCDETGTIDVDFSVVCSKGTYIRTICEDIGTALGFGGYCKKLRRVRNGDFSIEEAITPDALKSLITLQSPIPWVPRERVFSYMPAIALLQYEAEALRVGKKLPLEPFNDRIQNNSQSGETENRFRAMFGDTLVAVVYPDETSEPPILRIERVFDIK